MKLLLRDRVTGFYLYHQTLFHFPHFLFLISAPQESQQQKNTLFNKSSYSSIDVNEMDFSFDRNIYFAKKMEKDDLYVM